MIPILRKLLNMYISQIETISANWFELVYIPLYMTFNAIKMTKSDIANGNNNK